jgi:hypothetical protein
MPDTQVMRASLTALVKNFRQSGTGSVAGTSFSLAIFMRAILMATHQSPEQKKTVQRVMHEFKHGELKTARGSRKVKNPKQAIAIALHEAGASNYESPQKNQQNLRHTKAKERRGETYHDEKEGHRHRGILSSGHRQIGTPQNRKEREWQDARRVLYRSAPS